MPGSKEFIATFKAKGPEGEELAKETIQEMVGSTAPNCLSPEVTFYM